MFVRLVGLHVTNEVGYQSYREGMTPILTRYGGSFGYDLRVSEVLKAETDNPINRVFTIQFPNRATADAFFADESYQDVRKKFFDPSVTHATIMAAFERED